MLTIDNVIISGAMTVSGPPPQFTISPAVSGKSVWTPGTDGALNLSTAGTWTIVPNINFNINVKMWGSGGNSYQRCPSCSLGPGGAGGAAAGTIGLVGGTSYILQIGVGGGSARGGGYAGMFQSSVSQANARLVAGGGGGCGTNCGGPYGCEGGQAGGAGGGTTGQDAGPGGGTVSGTALQGGSSGTYGGGGGGGYWGGGGGSQPTVSFGSSIGGTGGTQTAGGTRANGAQGASGGGGGGGSGYLHNSVINGTLYAGSGTTPGNSGDANRGTAGNSDTQGKIYLYI